MPPLEFYVLLALSSGNLHGYAIKDAIANESGGSVSPRAGSLYRVLARLVTSGLIAETDARSTDEAHPGLTRRYYTLTARGRAALTIEARRLRGAAILAEKRLGVARRPS